jgi:hypothetical protein
MARPRSQRRRRSRPGLRVASCPARRRLAQPVERDGEDGDGEAGLEPGADVEPAQGRQHVVAEPAGTDHGRDDHHVEREHDHLVDAHHQRRPGGRELHPPEQLAVGAAGHPAVFGDLVGHLAQRQHGDADHGRHGVDDGRQHRRDRAEAEEDQDGHEIGEDRDGLHQVEDRAEQFLDPRRAVAGDAEQEAGAGGEGDGDDDRRERDHGTLPLAEDGEVAEGDDDQKGQPAAADAPGEPAERAVRASQETGAVQATAAEPTPVSMPVTSRLRASQSGHSITQAKKRVTSRKATGPMAAVSVSQAMPSRSHWAKGTCWPRGSSVAQRGMVPRGACMKAQETARMASRMAGVRSRSSARSRGSPGLVPRGSRGELAADQDPQDGASVELADRSAVLDHRHRSVGGLDLCRDVADPGVGRHLAREAGAVGRLHHRPGVRILALGASAVKAAT